MKATSKLFAGAALTVFAVWVLMAGGPVEIRIRDHAGVLITNAWVHVTDPAGRTVAKLAPAADGRYELDAALMGQKVVFHVEDASLGTFDTMDARIPEWTDGPVVVTMPGPVASPQGVPANDTCDGSIPIAVPSVTAGSTVGASVDNDVPDCITPNTAGGVWYQLVGTGNPITLWDPLESTCRHASLSIL